MLPLYSMTLLMVALDLNWDEVTFITSEELLIL